ncbi:hypothetical protein Tco_0684431 [Tanacetum coccineum]
MADNRTMAQMLQAPIEGYEDAIVVPTINANNFELKQTLINLVQKEITNAPLSTSKTSNSFEIQQLAASLEDKMDIRMSRLEKMISEKKPKPYTEEDNFNSKTSKTFKVQDFQPPTNQPPVYQVPPYQAPTPQIQGVSKTDFENYVKANDAVLKNVKNSSQTVTNPRQQINAITTRSEESEFEADLGKRFDSTGLDLTLPPTLEVSSSNPTSPTLTGETGHSWKMSMFFSLVRFVWKNA